MRALGELLALADGAARASMSFPLGLVAVISI